MQEKTSIKERRRFVRLNAAVDIQYSFLEAEPSERLNAKSKDISAGGICFISGEGIEKDKILVLSINLSDDPSPIMAKGRVAWVNPFEIGGEGKHYDIGIEFIEIESRDREKINKFVFSYKKP